VNTQPLEWAFLGSAVLSLFLTGYLFTLKLSDLAQVKRRGVNGAILFMKKDNLRATAFFLACSAGMLGLAISSVTNTDALNAQTKNLLVGMIAFALLIAGDSFFTYRRRTRMAVLVAAYEDQGRPGGRRASDPPMRGQ
jgi:hypothetical protein